MDSGLQMGMRTDLHEAVVNTMNVAVVVHVVDEVHVVNEIVWRAGVTGLDTKWISFGACF